MAGGDGTDTEGQKDSTEVTDAYPPLNQKKTTIAKDWDSALLQDCSMNRLRHIAQSYSGVTTRHNKEQTFEAICDAMADEMECLSTDTCPGGDCDPFKHIFGPIENPPDGWTLGADGKYAPPPADQEEVFPPGSSSVTRSKQNTRQPVDPVTANGRSIASLDLATSNFSASSPANALLRPSGSADVRTQSTGTPYVQGISNISTPPTDVASLVINGVKCFVLSMSIKCFVSSLCEEIEHIIQ